ncbi:MAG TPA: FecR domain-containing protein [Bacteroidales bacterium]|nr:FecR domain-containing protein [Bacteroidales bacterium]
MIEEDQKIWEIIEEVLHGNPTLADRLYLESWLQEDDNNRKTFETLKKVGLKVKIDSPEIKQGAFARIQSNMATENISRKLTLWRYGAVASIVAFLGLGIAFLYSLNFSSPKVAYVETKSPLGINTKVVLSDSTVVHLSPGSSLRYPAAFTGQKREIMLNGEAYFEVAKDKEHPFIVQTAHIDIRVFGTKFNVKAFNDDPNFVTTLMEGSVGISDKNQSGANPPLKLKPNQQAIYDHKTGKIQLRDVDASLYSEWKDGRTYFENETFVSIVEDIERKYNVSIKIAYEELKHEKFSGIIDKRKTVYQLLDGLGQYGNFSYKIVNDTIIIQKYNLVDTKK